MRKAIKIDLAEADRRALTSIVTDRNSPQKHVWRAQIVLLTADGCGTMELTRRPGTSKTSVWRWQERVMAEGGPGLLRDKTRAAGIPSLGCEVEARVVAATQTAAPGETTHWTSVAMARHIGISVSSVQRIWRKHGLQPHKSSVFKLPNDPLFAEKLIDIVGLYVDPPEHAVVLSIDEKSQIQALDRTQPGLPLKKGRCGTMTHDYKRNSTATLFAAMATPEGTVISMCDDRPRHQEWLKFLRVIDQVTPPEKDLHLIVDNYATHKHPKVQRWLERHPRFHIHFTPTSSSWLNMVERFFRDLTQNRLRRGIFHDPEELITAIGEYIDKHNQPPKPFIWTAKASDILEKVKRARRTLDNRHSA